MTCLTSRSDADPDVLADYVLALLRHDGDINDVRKLCEDEIPDFLKEGTFPMACSTAVLFAFGYVLKADWWRTSHHFERLTGFRERRVRGDRIPLLPARRPSPTSQEHRSSTSQFSRSTQFGPVLR